MKAVVSGLPLGLIDASQISQEEMAVLRRIEEYEFPYVKERVLEKNLIPADLVDEVITEFRRFFALMFLCRGQNKNLAVASEEVDEVWHAFILFTRLYLQFCKATTGYYVHHLPRTSHTPLKPGGNQNLREAYQKYFGELPKIWAAALGNDCSTSTASTGDSEWSGSDD